MSIKNNQNRHAYNDNIEAELPVSSFNQNHSGSALPFAIFILLLTSPFLFYLLGEKIYLVYFLFIFVYWFYRSFAYSVFSLITLINIRFINKNYKNINKTHNLIAIAVFNESYEVLEESLESITNQNYPKEKIYVSVSIEERRETSNPYELRKKLIKKYQNKLNLNVSIHTLSENEVAGAASNKHSAQKLGIEMLKNKNINLRDTIITIPDADTIFTNDYLEELNYRFRLCKDKYNSFFQTRLYKFDKSYLGSNIFTRILASGLTTSILSSSLLNEKSRYTFSCFSMNLASFIKCGMTDPSVPIDDTPFYFQALDKLNGKFQCIGLNSALYFKSIKGDTYIKSIIEQYKQYKRWGWGAISFIKLIEILRMNKQIGKIRKIQILATGIENFFLNKVIFPLIIINLFIIQNFTNINSTETFETIQIVLLINLFAFIPALITKLIVTPKPQKLFNKLGFIIQYILELPISLITVFTFGLIPYLHSSLEIMISANDYSKISWSQKSINLNNERK